MNDTEELGLDLSKLAEPFRANEIDWRIGSKFSNDTKAYVLAYMDARAPMKRLDDVCGVEGWQNRHPYANGKTCCEIGIWMGESHGWVWKANGAGDTAIEGDKGAFSDSFKRACVQWGIGRYLYDMPRTVVDIEAQGRSFKIVPNEYKKLYKVHDDLAASFGCPQGTHTGIKAIDDWVKTKVDGMNEYVKKSDATLDNLDKAYKIMQKHAVQSRITADQLFMISDQYYNVRQQLERKIAT